MDFFLSNLKEVLILIAGIYIFFLARDNKNKQNKLNGLKIERDLDEKKKVIFNTPLNELVDKSNKGRDSNKE